MISAAKSDDILEKLDDEGVKVREYKLNIRNNSQAP